MINIKQEKEQKKEEKMTVRGALCRVCQCFVYTRSPHDSRFCRCGRFRVEGIQEKAVVIEEGLSEIFSFILPVSADTLANDWSKGLTQYGIIGKSKFEELKGKQAELSGDGPITCSLLPETDSQRKKGHKSLNSGLGVSPDSF